MIGRTAQSIFFAMTLSVSSNLKAQGSVGRGMEWSMAFRSYLGSHLSDFGSLATHRHRIEFEQIARSSLGWTFKLGTSAQVEGAYGASPERYGDMSKTDGQEIVLTEASAQFRRGGFVAKVGTQTVVWGEAFGAFYADVVNPKDLREAGIGEMASLRRAVPMVNLQYLRSSWSAQAIYIPFFYSNLIPAAKSDFFPSYLVDKNAIETVSLDRSAEYDEPVGDYGGKLQWRIGRGDLSLFYLSMMDRQPWFVLDLGAGPSGSDLTINTWHSRVNVSGLTFSWANDDIVIRSELVYYWQRTINSAPKIADMQSGVLSRPEKSDQIIGVLGLDQTFDSGWTIGVQYSEDYLNTDSPQFRLKRESVIGLQILREWQKGPRLKLLGGYSTSDGGYMLQPSFYIPRGRFLEIGLEGAYFGGEKDSQFGGLERASRVMFVIRGYFNG